MLYDSRSIAARRDVGTTTVLEINTDDLPYTRTRTVRYRPMQYVAVPPRAKVHCGLLQ